MDIKQLNSEIYYKAIRSSGSGGQHANKVSSKVTLIFDIRKSEAFDDTEKAKLLKYFGNKVNSRGIIQLSSEESRSQFRNKRIVTERFYDLIQKALSVQKVRKKTKPSRSSILKSKINKKHLSEKKASRRKPKIE